MIAAGRGLGASPRALGAGLAAAISLAVALLLAGIAASDSLRPLVAREIVALVAVGAGIGVPVGAVLGWVTMPEVISGRGSRLWLVVRLSIWAVLIGAPAVAIVMAFGVSSPYLRGGAPLDVIGLLLASGDVIATWAVIYLMYGLVLFGLPAMALAAAVAAVWVAAIRALLGGANPPDGVAAQTERPDPARAAPANVVSPLLGWLAAGATVATAFALTWLRSTSDVPPGMVPGGLIGFATAFAGPALVAAAALVRRRREFLIVATTALICLAPLSMGGATLALLVPAVIFLYVARALPPGGRARFRLVGPAVATVSLLASPIFLFATTETVCWDDYGGGNVVVRVVPEMPNEQTSVAPFGSGCSSGSISAAGGALAVLAVAAAVAIAARSDHGAEGQA